MPISSVDISIYMNSNRIATKNGDVIAVEIKSTDDIKSDAFISRFGDYEVIGIIGFDDDDRGNMMWEISDGELDMGKLMDFINHFGRAVMLR